MGDFFVIGFFLSTFYRASRAAFSSSTYQGAPIMNLGWAERRIQDGTATMTTRLWVFALNIVFAIFQPMNWLVGFCFMGGAWLLL